MKILVYIESANNKIHPVSLESLVAAQKISELNGAEVHAVTFNKNSIEKYLPYKKFLDHYKGKYFWFNYNTHSEGFVNLISKLKSSL